MYMQMTSRNINNIAACFFLLSCATAAGLDYTAVSEATSLRNGSVTGELACVTVPLIDDMRFEKLESFTVHVRSEENVIIHGSRYTLVPIYDDDGKTGKDVTA